MLRDIIRVGCLLIVCALTSPAAFSQTTSVVNPRIVEFDPSADDSALTSDGQPVVMRYDLQIFQQGGTAPLVTVSLGKPAIDTDGKIRVDFSVLVPGWPLPDGTYDARVLAIGQSGAGQSDLSNLFAFQAASTPSVSAPCTYTLSPTLMTPAATGATSSVAVTTSATTCAWSAASDSDWVTVTPAGGTGPGTVSVTAAANAGAARIASVTIGGQVYTVNQATSPALCTYSLSPTSMTATAAGATASVAMTTSATTCGWTALSDSAWVTVNAASGVGPGSVSVTVAANTGAARTASVTIGGQKYTVSQAAVPVCTYSLSPTSMTAAATGATASVTVTTSATTCGWTASSDSAWVTVNAASGVGPGSVRVTVAANTGAARTALVTIGGQTYAVSQAAVPVCTYSASPTSVTAAGAGGASSVSVAASASSCQWTATSSAGWINVGTKKGTGSGSVAYSLSRNTSSATRIGRLTVGGAVVTVAQSSVPPPNPPKGVKVHVAGAK